MRANLNNISVEKQVRSQALACRQSFAINPDLPGLKKYPAKSLLFE
jgi:hypothetical protein